MADFLLHEVAGYSSDGVQVHVQAGHSSLLNKEFEFDSEMAYRLLSVQDDETMKPQLIEEVV